VAGFKAPYVQADGAARQHQVMY